MIQKMKYSSALNKLSKEYVDLYTIQNVNILDCFHDGIFKVEEEFCMFNYDGEKQKNTFEAYEWIKDKMNLQHYPIWASMKRIKRKRKLNWGYNQNCEIKFRAKVSDCFVTDFDLWHSCLNCFDLYDYDNDDLESIKKSWDDIIFPTPVKIKKITLQVCIPYLKMDNIQSVKYL